MLAGRRMLVAGQQPVLSRMLNQGEDSACHEPGRAHWTAGASDLGYFDDAAAGRDLDPPPRAGGDDLVGLHLAACVDDDLHPITFHTSSMPRTSPFAHRCATSGGAPRAPRAHVSASEVLAEPRRCEIADLIHGAGFLEEVTSPRHNRKLMRCG